MSLSDFADADYVLTGTRTGNDVYSQRRQWWEKAACYDVDPDIFTPPGPGRHNYQEARKLCASCPVRLQCLNEALNLGPDTTYVDGWSLPGESGSTMAAGFAMFQAGLTPRELSDLKRRRR